MKKNDFKKLRLSRETLRDLTSSDVQKAAGGLEEGVNSCPSHCGVDPGEGGITRPTGCGAV